MQTAREQFRKAASAAGYRPYQTPAEAMVSENQLKRVKMNEFRSWTVCFSIIVLLTGLMKVLKLGVTMESLNSILFYGSLGALAYLIYRMRTFPKASAQLKNNALHELN